MKSIKRAALELSYSVFVVIVAFFILLFLQAKSNARKIEFSHKGIPSYGIKLVLGFLTAKERTHFHRRLSVLTESSQWHRREKHGRPSPPLDAHLYVQKFLE